MKFKHLAFLISVVFFIFCVIEFVSKYGNGLGWFNAGCWAIIAGMKDSE